jgi:hypothetical protein
LHYSPLKNEVNSMKLQHVVSGAIIGGTAVAIATNPAPFIQVCNAVFNNTVAKSSALGLAAGLSLSAILLRKSRLTAKTTIRTHAGMGADIVSQLAKLFAPPIIGTLGGAAVGLAMSLGRHITIAIK